MSTSLTIERKDVIRRNLVNVYVDHDVLKKVKNNLNGNDQESCLIILSISFIYFYIDIGMGECIRGSISSRERGRDDCKHEGCNK